MRRLLTPLTATLILLFLVLPAQAASPKTGSWKGATYDAATGKYKYGKLSFKVKKKGKRKTIRNFKFVLYADCPPPYSYQVRNLIVPKMKVGRGGIVTEVYEGGSIYVNGKFRSKRRFSGRIEYKEPAIDPVCDGEARFKARAK